MSFYDQLSTGQIAEGYIARWLMARGAAVMPAYKIEISHGKGPQLFTAEGDFVLPDMLVFSPKKILWAEAKQKTVFTWHRISGQWTTGIDLHHYTQYLHVAKQTRLPVWLFFFHVEDRPSPMDVRHGCPSDCPTGLYAEDLFTLVGKESHRCKPKNGAHATHVGHGKSGMVYWAESALRKQAEREEVYAIPTPGGRAVPVGAPTHQTALPMRGPSNEAG